MVDVSVTTVGHEPDQRRRPLHLPGAANRHQALDQSAPSSGGSTVVITGTDLTAASTVSFGATGATQFTVNSPTSITAIAPPGQAGAVDVTVTNTAGTSATSSKDIFKYLPTVEALTPNSGSTLGGESVTVIGSGFVPGATLTTFEFGKTKAKAVSCASSTTCTVSAPAQGAGTVAVTATVNKASSPSDPPGDQFTYS